MSHPPRPATEYSLRPADVHHLMKCSMHTYIDQPVLLQITGNTQYIGTLLTFDHYLNIVLGNCVKRTFFKDKYFDSEPKLRLIPSNQFLFLGLGHKGDSNFEKGFSSSLTKEEFLAYREDAIAEAAALREIDSIGKSTKKLDIATDELEVL